MSIRIWLGSTTQKLFLTAPRLGLVLIPFQVPTALDVWLKHMGHPAMSSCPSLRGSQSNLQAGPASESWGSLSLWCLDPGPGTQGRDTASTRVCWRKEGKTGCVTIFVSVNIDRLTLSTCSLVSLCLLLLYKCVWAWRRFIRCYCV